MVFPRRKRSAFPIPPLFRPPLRDPEHWVHSKTKNIVGGQHQPFVSIIMYPPCLWAILGEEAGSVGLKGQRSSNCAKADPAKRLIRGDLKLIYFAN